MLPEEEPPANKKGALLLFLVASGLRLLYVAEMHGSDLWATPFGIAAFDHARALAILSGEESGGVFYHAALYAYFLAGVYSVFGPLELPVRLLQSVLGAATCVLVARVGARFFSQRVGLVAGFLLALYPPAILLDGVLQKASLSLFLLTSFLVVLGPGIERLHRRSFLLAGVLLGLLSMGRENALILYPATLAWMWFSSARVAGERIARALIFTLGVALPLLAAGLRNYAVADEFVPGASNAGASIYIGNRAGASGLFDGLVTGRGIAIYDPVDARQLAEGDTGGELSGGELTSYWLRRTAADVASDPAGWFALLARKACYVLSAKEWAGAYDLQAFRAHSSLLRVLGFPLRYGFLVPLALVGLVLAWPARRRCALLYVQLAALVLSIVLTFVDPRFRFGLMPLLLPFAAAALVRLFELGRAGHWRGLAATGGSVVVLIGLVHLPTGVEDWSESSTYNKLGLALNAVERHDEAFEMYLRAIEVEPDNPSAHFNAGVHLLDRGEIERGLEHLETAKDLEPAFLASYHLELGIVAAESGDLGFAQRSLERARQIDPLDPDVHFNLALVLRRLERWEEAEAAYRESLRLRPGNVEARNNLAFLLALVGRRAEAIEEYEAALALQPDFVRARVNLAWILATDANLRDGPAALVHAARARELDGAPNVVLTLAAAHAACGEFGEALRLAESAGNTAHAEAYRAETPWTE